MLRILNSHIDSLKAFYSSDKNEELKNSQNISQNSFQDEKKPFWKKLKKTAFIAGLIFTAGIVSYFVSRSRGSKIALKSEIINPENEMIAQQPINSKPDLLNHFLNGKNFNQVSSTETHEDCCFLPAQLVQNRSDDPPKNFEDDESPLLKDIHQHSVLNEELTIEKVDEKKIETAHPGFFITLQNFSAFLGISSILIWLYKKASQPNPSIGDENKTFIINCNFDDKVPDSLSFSETVQSQSFEKFHSPEKFQKHIFKNLVEGQTYPIAIDQESITGDKKFVYANDPNLLKTTFLDNFPYLIFGNLSSNNKIPITLNDGELLISFTLVDSKNEKVNFFLPYIFLLRMKNKLHPDEHGNLSIPLKYRHPSEKEYKSFSLQFNFNSVCEVQLYRSNKKTQGSNEEWLKSIENQQFYDGVSRATALHRSTNKMKYYQKPSAVFEKHELPFLVMEKELKNNNKVFEKEITITKNSNINIIDCTEFLNLFNGHKKEKVVFSEKKSLYYANITKDFIEIPLAQIIGKVEKYIIMISDNMLIFYQKFSHEEGVVTNNGECRISHLIFKERNIENFNAKNMRENLGNATVINKDKGGGFFLRIPLSTIEQKFTSGNQISTKFFL